jgi:hypothetical protein
MKRVMRWVGVVGTLILIAVSVSMNFRFGLSLGKSEWDGLVLGMASAGADGFKVILPFAVAYAWRSSRYLATAVGVVLWALFTAYSMTSSLGHSASNRSEVAGEKRHGMAVYQDLEHAIAAKQREREQLPSFRPPATVEAELAAKTLDWRWIKSQQCRSAYNSDLRQFCGGVSKLNGELANGQRGAVLDDELDRLRAKRLATGGEGAAGSADAQVALIGQLLGVEETTIKLALTILVSLMVELGSGLGLFVIFDDQVRRRAGQSNGEGGAGEEGVMVEKLPLEVVWFRSRVQSVGQESFESESALFRDYCRFVVACNAGPALSLEKFRSFLQQQQTGAVVRKGGRTYVCGVALRETAVMGKAA